MPPFSSFVRFGLTLPPPRLHCAHHSYWLIAGFLITLESLALPTLLWLAPRYWALKLALLAWAGVVHEGAAVVWERLLRERVTALAAAGFLGGGTVITTAGLSSSGGGAVAAAALAAQHADHEAQKKKES